MEGAIESALTALACPDRRGDDEASPEIQLLALFRNGTSTTAFSRLTFGVFTCYIEGMHFVGIGETIQQYAFAWDKPHFFIIVGKRAGLKDFCIKTTW